MKNFIDKAGSIWGDECIVGSNEKETGKRKCLKEGWRYLKSVLKNCRGLLLRNWASKGGNYKKGKNFEIKSRSLVKPTIRIRIFEIRKF